MPHSRERRRKRISLRLRVSQTKARIQHSRYNEESAEPPLARRARTTTPLLSTKEQFIPRKQRLALAAAVKKALQAGGERMKTGTPARKQPVRDTKRIRDDDARPGQDMVIEYDDSEVVRRLDLTHQEAGTTTQLLKVLVPIQAAARPTPKAAKSTPRPSEQYSIADAPISPLSPDEEAKSPSSDSYGGLSDVSSLSDTGSLELSPATPPLADQIPSIGAESPHTPIRIPEPPKIKRRAGPGTILRG